MYTIGRWKRAHGGPAIRIPTRAVKELIISLDTDVLDLGLALHKGRWTQLQKTSV